MNDALGETFTAPLGDAHEGTLELLRATGVTLRAAALDGLCEAAFELPPLRAQADGTRVRIEFPRFSLASLLRRPTEVGEIVLNAALPWSVAIAGGLADSTLDLSALDLRGVELSGCGSGVRIVLPPPRGRVDVRLAGGANDILLLRPGGVAAVLRLERGGSRVAFDRALYGVIGNNAQLETTDGGRAADRYEIEIAGCATRLTIAEEEPRP